MTPAGAGQDISSLLAEQVGFYRAVAPEYERHAIRGAWGGEPAAALEAFAPARRYDVVFFGFWLSHVPLERFAEFWSRVEAWLEPAGRVFFVDDAHRTAEELVWGESSPLVQRRLTDGTAHRIVKVPHRPEELERRLRKLGWAIRVNASEQAPFYWGEGAVGTAQSTCSS